MPVVTAEKYVPDICKTLWSRREFIEKYLPVSKPWRTSENVGATEVRVLSETGGRFWFFWVFKDDLAYIMHLNPIRFQDPDRLLPFRGKPMYQRSVWRQRIQGLPAGASRIPRGVFWSLLSNNRVWFSDFIQSEDGKAFWENRILDALQKGLKVAAVEFRDHAGTVEVVKVEPLTLQSPIDHYWTYEVNEDGSGMSWRFVISH
jgi:hypothetical protein